MGLVSTHQLSTFTTPVNGTSPIDANQVKGNDNSIKTSYNAHDADTTIHLQSGAVATRPAASTAGQTWLATDSGAVYLWLDNGSAWVEANYLRNTGGTVTGNVLVTGTLGVTGATTLSSTLTIGGVTYTFPASQAANQYLRTDGSGTLTWVNVLESLALTDLSDVTITSVASGQFLLYNGTVWVNGTNGSALTTLNASNLSSGTVNTARVAGSYTGITAVGTLTAGAISTGFTAIADTYLATISTASKVSNSATTATNANTASAIVARDASGNFTAGTVTAALTGNATTATTLATARAINGVNFDGSAAITVTAAAGTLSGTTLASNVTLSSLTSVGTLSAGAVPASLVTAGTFGAGAYTFPGALAITGAFTGATTGAFSGTVSTGALTATTGADRTVLIAQNSDSSTYNVISLSGSASNAGHLGFMGGATGNNSLYIDVPTGGAFNFRVNVSNVASISTTGALAISGAFTGATTGAFSGAVSTGALTSTTGQFSGEIGMGGAPYAGIGVYLRTTFALSGANQYGIVLEPKGTSASTGSLTGLQIGLQTTAASYTTTAARGVYIADVTIGAGSAITTLYGLLIGDQVGGGTNYAIYTGAGLVRFGGAATFSSTVQGASTISVGAATPSNSGAGITFPATQSPSTNVNTLDDYEEGTWTATLTCGTSGTITLGSYTLTYTKIGKLVHVEAFIQVASVSSPVGGVTLGGLPFQAKAEYSAVSLRMDGMAGAPVGVYQGYVSINSTNIVLERYSLGNAIGSVAQDFAVGSTIILSATYVATQ